MCAQEWLLRPRSPAADRANQIRDDAVRLAYAAAGDLLDDLEELWSIHAESVLRMTRMLTGGAYAYVARGLVAKLAKAQEVFDLVAARWRKAALQLPEFDWDGTVLNTAYDHLLGRASITLTVVSGIPRYAELGQLSPSDPISDELCQAIEVELDRLMKLFRKLGGREVGRLRERLWREAMRTDETVEQQVATDFPATTTSHDHEAELVQITAAVGGESAAQIVAIARDVKLTADDRLEKLSKLDSRYFGWNSPKLANLLGNVTPQAVRQTDWWTITRPAANSK